MKPDMRSSARQIGQQVLGLDGDDADPNHAHMTLTADSYVSMGISPKATGSMCGAEFPSVFRRSEPRSLQRTGRD